MKKKFWLLLALAGSILCAVFGLTACGETGNGGNDKNDPPAHTTHVWSTTYTEDGDRHYQTCSGCNEKKYSDHDFTNGDCVCGKQKPVEIHTHKMTKHDAVAATCTKAGNVLYYSCSGCHKNFSDKDGKTELKETAIPATGHTMTEHEAKEPTCTTAGNVLYYSCSDCNKNFADKEGKSELKETVIPAGHNMTKHDAVEPTCTTAGNVLYYSCSGCGKTFSDKNGRTELTETSIPATHKWSNNICTVCGYDAGGSKGLSYTLSLSGNNYKVSGIGTCTDIEIVIPETYNGKPVTSIGGNAFRYCSSLTGITIPNSVTSIEEYAFQKCDSLMSVTYTGDIKSWCNINGLYYLMSSGISSRKLFIDGQEITGELVIPDDVTKIEDAAFLGCGSLTSIVIYTNVTSIGKDVFGQDYAATIYCQESKRPNGWLSSWNSSNCPVVWDCNNNQKDANKFKYAIIDGVRYSLLDGATNADKGIATVVRQPNNVKSVKIPDSVKHLGLEYTVTGIQNEAFSNCISLTNVEMSNNVTSIGQEVFNSCSSLTSVTISERVTSLDYRAFYECGSLTSIVIPDSVTSIGQEAFGGCSSLTSVTIDNGVTSIGYSAFNGCSSLTSVTIPDSVTSIGDRAFYECGSLTGVVIPDSVTSIGAYAFYNCSSLTSVTIPDSVTSIGDYAFYRSPVESVTLPISALNCFPNNNFNLKIVVLTSGESIQDYAFRYCSSLTSVTIPDSVTSIGNSAFYECSSLTSVVIPDSVTSIGNSAFEDCSSLTSVTILDSVTSIGNSAFKYCDSLTIYCEAIEKPSNWDSDWNYSRCPVVWDCKNNQKDGSGYEYAVIDGIRYSFKDGEVNIVQQPRNITAANIPATVTYKENIYSMTSIGNSAFEYCRSLTSVIIPDSVMSIEGGAFFGCDSLTYNEYNNGKYLGNENNPYFAFIDTTSTDITICTIHNDTKVIADYAFKDCSSLTSVTIPDGVTSIGEYTFYGCSSLRSVGIPNGVTSIGNYAFDGCSSLTSVTIPDSVTSIGDWAFDGCSSLTSVVIPNGVTSIGSSAFDYCSSIESVTWNAISCTGAGSYFRPVFSRCTNLKTVTFGENVKIIPAYAFYECGSLTSVVIPDSVTSIGESAFRGCPIESAVIPALAISFIAQTDLKTVVITSGESIVDYAFSNCSSLTSVTIPDSVTSIGVSAFRDCKSLAYNEYNNALYLGNDTNPYVVLIGAKSKDITACTIHKDTKVIYGGAFSGCSSLTSVIIPDSVTSIGAQAFYGCSSLTSVTIPDSVTSIGERAFSGCNSLNYNVYDNGKYLGNKNNPYVAFIDTTSTNITVCTIYNDTKVIYVGAFSGCNSLTSVVIPDSVTNIEEGAFYGCSSLTSVTIPDSVTSIGTSAFASCSSLTSVTIPDSVTSIGNQAFSDCSLLTDIAYQGTKAEWEAIEKFDDWDYNTGNYTVHCTDGDIEKGE